MQGESIEIGSDSTKRKDSDSDERKQDFHNS